MSPELGGQALVRLFTTPRRHPRPAREAAVLARGRRFTVDVPLRSPRSRGAHAEVVAWRWGVGPTVLLVHGWEGRGSQLGCVVEPLLDAGLSVVAFDAPGHGDSPGNRLLLTDLADVIAAVADAAGPLHAVVAHSFGGAGVLLAHARRELSAARLVLVAPNGLVDLAIDSFSTTLALGADERAAFVTRLEADSGVSLDDLGLRALVAGGGASMLIVHDEDDREIPLAAGVAVATAWPGARLRRTVGLGHRRILRDPDVLAGITAFVADGVARPSGDLAAALGAGWADRIDLGAFTE
ncbi:MAG: alpha/beta fold hydrolase [Kofleriaceae bacterium]